MTAQPRPGSTAKALRLPPLPNPPRKTDMQENLHFDRPAEMNTLARHLGALREDSHHFHRRTGLPLPASQRPAFMSLTRYDCGLWRRNHRHRRNQRLRD